MDFSFLDGMFFKLEDPLSANKENSSIGEPARR